MHEKPTLVKFRPEIQQIVNMGLEMDFSPEQIVGRSKLQKVEGMVSHERIYQYVWKDKRNGGDWHKHLRRKGRHHRKRGNKRDNRGIIRDRVSIDQRPAVVEDKKRFGDLEVDLVVGRNHKGALLTVNDRAGYLPKGTSFENLTEDDILLIQNKLNN